LNGRSKGTRPKRGKGGAIGGEGDRQKKKKKNWPAGLNQVGQPLKGVEKWGGGKEEKVSVQYVFKHPTEGKCDSFRANGTNKEDTEQHTTKKRPELEDRDQGSLTYSEVGRDRVGGSPNRVLGKLSRAGGFSQKGHAVVEGKDGCKSHQAKFGELKNSKDKVRVKRSRREGMREQRSKRGGLGTKRSSGQHRGQWKKETEGEKTSP